MRNILLTESESKLVKEESNKTSKRIDFKNKIELSMGEKVELNVKLKRGQIEKLHIDEELKQEIYSHFLKISDKKKEYIALSFQKSNEKGNKVYIELGKKCYLIESVFNMLRVTETDKRGKEKIYFLKVK